MREALWLLALLLAAYAAVEFLRALRLPQRGEGAAAPGAPPRRAAVDAGGARDGEGEEDGDFVSHASLPAAAAADAPPPDHAAERFELELENSRLRQALQAERDLVALQQSEIERLVEDLTALRDALERQGGAVESAPEYTEALVLAAQGLNAGMIAERCGITLAEAGLVLALARRGEGAQ